MKWLLLVSLNTFALQLFSQQVFAVDAAQAPVVTEPWIYKDLNCSKGETPTLSATGSHAIITDFKSQADCRGLLALLRKKSASTQFVKGTLDGNLSRRFSYEPGTTGFSLKYCEDRNSRYHLTKNTNGIIDQDCAPEVLYSWGGYDKLNWFASNIGNKATWPERLPRGLFTTSSAAGTFGYGPVALRVKVKPTVKFKLLLSPSTSTCEGYLSMGYITFEQMKNTILTRVDLRSNGISFMEYTICSPQVIESWSYGTREHFDEILRDHQWMTTKHYYDWEAYAKQNGVDLYLNNTLDAGLAPYKTLYSIPILQRRMGFLRALIQDGFGEIMGTSDEARKKHFQITKPNYFLRKF